MYNLKTSTSLALNFKMLQATKSIKVEKELRWKCKYHPFISSLIFYWPYFPEFINFSSKFKSHVKIKCFNIFIIFYVQNIHDDV